MTTPTAPANNNLDVIISREPRLAAVGNKNLQMFIASQMLMGMDFDTAEANVLNLIQGADTYKAEVKANIEAKRTEAETTVKDTLRDLVLETMSSLSTAPQYGVTIIYDPRFSYKNPDGSPMMENNEPVVKPFVDFRFQWDNKGRSATSGRTIGDTSKMGRPEGDYVIEGESEVYKSMAAFAKAKWASEFENYQGPSRDFLTSKGYVVPTAPETDDEGKKHWIITKATETVAA